MKVYLEALRKGSFWAAKSESPIFDIVNYFLVRLRLKGSKRLDIKIVSKSREVRQNPTSKIVVFYFIVFFRFLLSGAV